MFAKTNKRWGNGQSYYDLGLGCEVENSMHKERIMEERNIIPLSKEVAEQQDYTLEREMKAAAKHEASYGTAEGAEKINKAIDNL